MVVTYSAWGGHIALDGPRSFWDRRVFSDIPWILNGITVMKTKADERWALLSDAFLLIIKSLSDSLFNRRFCNFVYLMTSRVVYEP